MARKQPDMKGLFSKTEAPSATPPAPSAPPAEAAPVYDLDAGVIRAMGVGLKTGEAEALADIAHRHGLTRNALGRIAVRYFLREVIAGRVDVNDYIKTTTTKTTRLP